MSGIMSATSCQCRRANATGPALYIGVILPPAGSLGYCTCAQEAISTKAQEHHGLGSGLQDQRYRCVTQECNGNMTRGYRTHKEAAAPQRHVTTFDCPPAIRPRDVSVADRMQVR